MTPWVRLTIKTGNNEVIPRFWWNFYTHPLSDILNKYNIKEDTSKGNIWGTLYIPKGECSVNG